MCSRFIVERLRSNEPNSNNDLDYSMDELDRTKEQISLLEETNETNSSEIDELNETIKMLKNQIDLLADDLDEANSFNASLNLEVDEITESYSNLKVDYDKLEENDGNDSVFNMLIDRSINEVYDSYGLPSKDYFISLIQKTIDIYMMYNVSSLNYDPESTNVIDDVIYYRVQDKRFPDYQSFVAFISDCYADDFVEDYLKSNLYINIDGELYTSTGEAGSLLSSDWHLSLVGYNSEEIWFELYFIDSSGFEPSVVTMTVTMADFDGDWKVTEQNYSF